MNEGHIFLEGVIDSATVEDIKRQLSVNSDADSLVLHISSPGGSVYDGYTIYHHLLSTGKKIKAIIEGQAQSMATFISLAATEIEMREPSVYMIHNPSQGLQGDADMLEGGADELRKIEDEMANAYAEKTKLPVEEIKKMMKKETRMNAFEAVQKGFVDRKVTQLKAVAFGREYIKEQNKISELLTELKQLINKNGR